MSGRQVKAQRRAAGLTPEVLRSHREFERMLVDQELRWQAAGPALRSRRVKRTVLALGAAVVALGVFLAWVGA